MLDSDDTTILANTIIDDERLMLSYDESDGEEFLTTNYSMDSWGR